MQSARAVPELWLCYLQLIDLRPKLLNFPKVGNTSIQRDNIQRAVTRLKETPVKNIHPAPDIE